MKWDDNLLLEGDWEDLKVRGQWQLAMCAVHLGSGHSIYCKRIRSATVEQCVFAAASFLAVFTGHDLLVMHKLARELGSLQAPNSLVRALVEGFEEGLCLGYRVSE